MNPKATIRSYQNTDRQSIIDLFLLNTPTYFSEEEEVDLHRYLDEEIDEYFVVQIDGEIVGCGGINFSDNQSKGVISWDILHPDFQGKGIGSQLLQFRIERIIKHHHIPKIIVRTSQHVYRFYEKNGFELKEATPDYWAPGFDLYYMEYRPSLSE